MNKSNIFAAAVTGMMLASSAMAEHHEKKAEAGKGTKPEAKKADAKSEKKSGEAMKTVHCLGINDCKGKSECNVKGAHTCSGANDCKGKGWISVSMKECTDKKGKIVE
ncbi:MAG: hypothetical protein SGJ18_13820 [Pseudomonadota bacterium]|nr:hypothetical protein [Pseudomonadota bacterium]